MKKKLFAAGVCAVAAFCSDAIPHLNAKNATITLHATVPPSFNFDAANIIIDNALDLLDSFGQPKHEHDRTVTYSLKDGAKFKMRAVSDSNAYELQCNGASDTITHTVKVKYNTATNQNPEDLLYNTEKEITVADGVNFKIIIDDIVVPENNGNAKRVFGETITIYFTASN